MMTVADEPAEQFATIGQQRAAMQMGLWGFLATEILFFGGLFAAYATYRALYPIGFISAAGETDIAIGTINTAVLLTSSAFVALAAERAQAMRKRAVVTLLAGAVALGLAFLALKGVEYAKDAHDHLVPWLNDFVPHLAGQKGAALFFWLYYAITFVHALHVTIGITLLTILAIRSAQNAMTPHCARAVELAGLYWHFVDIVWIAVYPLLYLAGRNGS